ncbi:hypothetical protein J18TS1_27490 [Oceanobacillus oncorhynchi subsp. incaldanensis]|uniref:polysaccharide pyruvyl transferase family protein n=1 Tax=Oceanobacillus oncorhynchi TaxID=545501 RepID=UPI001B181BD2|nr:polysaccharide pyruvyl transferase family protein [Oceanobacillus oncorhynchi]GIO19649.1 hypothetical protein J18TS1_27490 [Oceanobacillus oncorhynchi subsp. incaldanensis]
MKKIMINAYTNLNLGDDLFIKILIERYPNTKFILYAPKKYKEIFKNNKNIKIYNKDNIVYRAFDLIFRQLRLNFTIKDLIANKANAIVKIGGSIFIQNKGWNIKNISRSLIPKRKPIFVIGANFGPYTDENFYKFHYNLFQNYTDVCFRDSKSRDLFKDLNNVRQADDVVFQLEGVKTLYSKNSIVISVIKPSIRDSLKEYDNIYYNKLKDIITYYVNNNYTVNMLSFCCNEKDDEAIKKIKNLLPDKIKKHVKGNYYNGDINNFLEIISSAKYVIATRFHAMILGWVYNKPVFPICYSEKMNNVLNDVNFEGLKTDLDLINHLTIKDVIEGMEKNLINIDCSINNSTNQFLKLDKYINM